MPFRKGGGLSYQLIKMKSHIFPYPIITADLKKFIEDFIILADRLIVKIIKY